MKKLILSLLVGLLPVTLVYAEIDTDLLRKEIGTMIESEIKVPVAEIDFEADMEPNEEADDPNKILQEYIDFCGGNEKLGKILYEERNGRVSRANALGQFVVDKTFERDWRKGKYDLALTGFLPFANVKSINSYYPDGIWIVDLKKEEVKHIPGPLVGALNSGELYLSPTYDGPRLFGNKYLYVDFYYVVYNEEGKEAFSKVKSYELSISGHMLGGEELGDFGKFKIHYITLLNELANTVFDNEEAAQNLLNKHKAKKEKKEKKAIEKEKKEKKKQKRKKAINETWENLFH